MEWLKNLVDYGVISLLVLLSIIAVGCAIERHMTYRRINLHDFSEKKALEMELTDKLHLIATIASNSPYLGLLGTVLGIMLTFATMGKEGFMDTSKVMVGLALSMKATAAGLCVAIPSTVVYNLLLRRVKVLMFKWEIMNGRKGV
jgi:biopolymer transport protein ExbB